MNDRVFVVLMAGGSGTRFWPLSRRVRPKQVLPIADHRPMIRATVDRLGDEIPPERVLVVTGADQADAIRQALPEIPDENVIAEPAPRNTAPCIGLAAVTAFARDPAAVLLCLPADHVIRPEEAFRETARRAVERAEAASTLLTFGVAPTWASTGYGYLEQGSPTAPGIFRVSRFVEKPPREKAEEYVASGNYRWNSGMFAWRADVFLAEIEKHLPDLATGLDEIRRDPLALDRVFPGLPKVSVDNGVMEVTDRVEMVTADFEWDDVGSFEALSRLLTPDPDGNCSRTGLLTLASKRILAVAPEGHLVAAVGVEDLIVVVTDDATLVCRREDAERVKELVERLPEELR